ncbi:complement receptor type 1-like [Numida meleagris]|uniref:complement receptor type 1-like n=1 Tax=Numida meleagris TaxID=8996 RepID=UPI000B3E22AF|nr:complement receptor type 1-like [Numida meleagris]
MRMVPAPEAVRPRGCAAVLVLLLTAALVVDTQGACGAPPRFPFAELKEDYLHNTTFSSGDKVEYSCRPGYMRKLGAQNTYICDRNKWKGSNNFCIPRLCNYPGEPTNGRLVEVQQFSFGSIANYSCDTGHRLVGNSQIKCVIKDGHVGWDGNVPVCEPIPCLPPPKIENGDHNGGDVTLFTYGSSVTYRCHTDSRGNKRFSMVGDASIFCTTTDNLNGVWNKPAPECKVVSCRQPWVEHGKLQSMYRAEYTYGDTVVLDCEFRYSLEGSDTAMCQEDGSWDPPLPLCQRSSCDDPPDVQNAVKARLAGNLFPVETVITYECKTGYEFSPGVTMQHVSCLPDFTWSETPPPCERISCPNPATKRGMDVSFWDKKDVYVFGDRVRIICDPGYVFKDDANYVVLQCTNNGTWNRPAPECVPEPHCSKPVIDHGREVYRSKTDYSVGTQLRIECDEGYVLIAQELVTCQADGNWFPTLPYCQQVCGPPPQGTHGLNINSTSSFFPYGYRVNYDCPPGLSLIGDESIYCTSEDGVNLEWSGPAPECRAVHCPTPVVEHGEMVPLRHTFPYGTSVSFYCKKGFALHGNAESRCAADGIWQPDLPQCQPVKCPVPSSKEEDLEIFSNKEKYEFDESLHFSCKQSRDPAEILLTTCSSDGSWMPPPSCKTFYVCKKIRQIQETFKCGIPLPELKTLLEVQKLYLEIQKLQKELGAKRGHWWHNSALSVPCSLLSPRSAEGEQCCRQRGPPACPPLPPPASPSPEIFCSPVARPLLAMWVLLGWMGPLLVLQPAGSLAPEVRCPIPVIAHGRLNPAPKNFTSGSKAMLECDAGYVPAGGSTVWCLSSGRLQPRTPACIRGRCPAPPAVDHADRRTSYELLVGSTVTYFCRHGYTLIPGVSPTTTCLNNFTWSAIPALCQMVQCPSPTIINGREMSAKQDKYSVGQQVEFQCDLGYMMWGSQRAQCWSDGTWKPPVPFCDKVCPPPPHITNGQHTGLRTDLFPYGMEVKYSCASGLSLIGDESIYCTSEDGVNLTWSGPAPECRVVRCPRPVVAQGRMVLPWHTFPYGMSVRFSCNEGFVLHGNAESRCAADGSWQPALPKCQPVLCPKPRVANGWLTSTDQTWYPANATVTFECHKGYQLSGDGEDVFKGPWTATCLADGNWTALPKCKKPGDADVCGEVARIQSVVSDCHVPTEDVKTLLEIQKLFLEIQKLKVELQGLSKEDLEPILH